MFPFGGDEFDLFAREEEFDFDSDLAERAESFGLQGALGLLPLSGLNRGRLEDFVQMMEANSSANLGFVPVGGVLQEAGDGRSGRFKFRLRVLRRPIGGRKVDHNMFDLDDEVEVLFDRILQYVRAVRGLTTRTRLGVQLNDGSTDRFRTDPDNPESPIRIHSVYIEVPIQREMTGEDILEAILLGESESDKTLDFLTTVVYVQFFLGPFGGAGDIPVGEWLAKKKCVYSIVERNERKDCFWQAVVMGQAFYTDKTLFCKLRHARDSQYLRERMGEQCRERCRGGINVSVDDIPAIERALNQSISVIQYPKMDFIYRGLHDMRKRILLLMTGQHYHLVNPLKAHRLWDKRHFCFGCLRYYGSPRHNCSFVCDYCGCDGCPGHGQVGPQVKCRKCLRKFFNDECYANHKRIKWCEKRKECETCSQIQSRREEHRCYKRKCSSCKEWSTIGEHQCYHQSLKKANDPSEQIVFYDFESMLVGGLHEVVGVVAMTYSGDEKHRFKSVPEFMDWVLSGDYRGWTFIAHNAGRYDLHFIKAYMLDKKLESNDIVCSRTIFQSVLKKEDVKFMDSVKFIPMALRKFPETFGIEELAKGYFPYTFLTPDTLRYLGPMPDVKYFCFDNLSVKLKKEALVWYEEHKNDEIDLYEEMMKYCESDVLLLREGVKRYRDLFLRVTEGEVDPFTSGMTIAGVCKKIYERFHLPPKSIAALPLPANDELYALEWCHYIENTEHIALEESKDPHVTAEYEDRIFIYHPCLDHGHHKCYRRFGMHPSKMVMFKDLWNTYVKELHAKYENRGLSVVSVWGCEWELMRVGKTFDIRRPMQMRDGFYGGRTEPTKLYYKCQGDEKIRYVDYTSLYPAVQYGVFRGLTSETYKDKRIVEYPVGHPVYISKQYPDVIKDFGFGRIQQYFGFVHCRVQPPEGLYHPVLPDRRMKNGKCEKLVFDLKEKEGMWTTVELEKAWEKGYTLLEVYEIIHFPERRSDLFRDYVKTFLKIKQEAGGWSKYGCSTEAEKDEYVERYKEEMGIEMEKHRVEHNPGLYYIAKLCLNSLWGKYGQRDMFSTTKDTFTSDQFDAIMENDENQILTVLLHENDARTVKYKKKCAFSSAPASTNIAIAAFTTAYARLRLYEALELLGDAVLYMDTDSVIFVDRGQDVVLGDYLGDLTDELDAGDWITEFVSTGPKSYAYNTHKGKQVCKVKGFTLNAGASQVLHFDAMKRMVNGDPKPVVTRPFQLVIDATHKIVTKEWKEGQGKEFRMTFDKRHIDWENRNNQCIDTVPFQ